MGLQDKDIGTVKVSSGLIPITENLTFSSRLFTTVLLISVLTGRTGDRKGTSSV